MKLFCVVLLAKSSLALRFYFSISFIVEACINICPQIHTCDFILLSTFLLFRFQSYFPDGFVCDVRCLLGDDNDNDLQEIS